MKQKSKQKNYFYLFGLVFINLALTSILLIPAAASAQTAGGGHCAYPSDCNTGYTCDPSSSLSCQVGVAGLPCDTNNNCQAGVVCISGICQQNTGTTTSPGTPGSTPTPTDSNTFAPIPTPSCDPTISKCSGVVVCPSGLAQDSASGLCLPISNPFPTTGIAASSSLSGLILTIIKFLLFFSGIVAVLFLIIGGFLYMSSGGNEEQAEKGKKTIVNFALGLAVIIMAYAIVTILNNALTDNSYTTTNNSVNTNITGN